MLIENNEPDVVLINDIIPKAQSVPIGRAYLNLDIKLNKLKKETKLGFKHSPAHTQSRSLLICCEVTQNDSVLFIIVCMYLYLILLK